MFVIADSGNQVWYKKVIKALSVILDERTDHTEATQIPLAVDVATHTPSNSLFH